MHFRRSHSNQRYKSEKWPADRHFRFHDSRCFARVVTYTRSVGIPPVRSHRYLYARPIPVSNTVMVGQLLPAAAPLRPPDIYFPARSKSTSYFDYFLECSSKKVRSVHYRWNLWPRRQFIRFESLAEYRYGICIVIEFVVTWSIHFFDRNILWNDRSSMISN